jgi:hypothetical protein
LNKLYNHKGMLIAINCGDPALDLYINRIKYVRFGSFDSFKENIINFNEEKLEKIIFPSIRDSWNNPDYEINLKFKEIPFERLKIKIYD